MKELYEQLGISSQVYDFCHEIEESLKERFEKFDKTAEYNQMKVLLAMQKKNRVSEECFGSSSGYGYNDYGRDTLKRFMPIPSTQKPAWYARRLRVEHMPWPLLFLETCVQAMKCWHQPESHMILLKR